ncbi:MAG: CRISPR-associated helicase Cas3' [Deltaproteobacteria bacterium]
MANENQSNNFIVESINTESGLFSHPGKFLENHTQAVTDLALLSLENNPAGIIDKETLRKVAKIITTSHDLGKATSYFQQYITAKTREEREKLKSRKSSHALFGSVIAYFLTKELLQREGKYDGLFRFVPIASFLVCKRHHGNLGDVYNCEIEFQDSDISLLQEQLESIDKQKFNVLLEKLGSPFSYEWLCERFKKIKDASYEMLDEYEAMYGKESYDYYFLIHLIYSLLLDADKNEVAVSEKDREEIANFGSKINLSHEIVSCYKQKQNWEKKDIDELREQAFQEVLSREINLDEKIYSINLPTGLGKTLTSLAFALKLREKMQKDRSNSSRIIYSLPFLSVIDQNCKVFEDALKASDIEPLSPVLLKHHHLADVNYHWKTDYEDFEFDASNIMIEGWNSEIVVTTFIQLFHTLISNKNRSIRKFHRIAGSIVILDEIQAIPHKYWLLMRDIIRFMAEKFSTYFIFVTATEPLIFKRGETVSLVEREKYFSSLHRVILKPDIAESRTIREFAGSVITEALKGDKRFLFIFNTIGSAKEFYSLLRESGLKREEMTYLSTHVIPKERLRRIDEIRERKKRIAVTTQLVEAGVDIDFDVVYRDFCPLDSINQSAGRCNRNGLSAGREIRVIRLRDGKTGREYSTYIYNKDSILLDRTRKVLSGREEIGESEFLNLIDEYYKLIAEAKSDQKSRDILKAFYRLNYDGDNGIWTFRLIEEDYEKVDIFIQFDNEAINIWEKFLDIRETQNPFERREKFDKIKAKFYEYSVSVPKRGGVNLPAIDEGMPFVSSSQIDEYYDFETGYKLKGGVAIW